MRPLGYAYASSQKEPSDEPQVAVNFRMSRTIYRAFKSHCIMHDLEIGKTLAALLTRYMRESAGG